MRTHGVRGIDVIVNPTVTDRGVLENLACVLRTNETVEI